MHVFLQEPGAFVNDIRPAMSTTGRFIVFEGLDGAGTTSQMARLCAYLRRRDLSVHGTAEPSSGPVGRLLRQLLGGAAAPFDPDAMALLFAADRRDHLAREVLPYLRAGVHVLCDRYVLSSLAYQAVAGAGRDLIAAANAGVRRPDLTLLLAVPAEVAAGRRAARDAAAELYETDATQHAVARRYAEEAARLRDAGEPVVVVDGIGTVEEVEIHVRKAVESCLALPPEAPSEL